jgi:hypothetical protein
MAAVARMAWELAPEVMVLEDVMRTTSLEQLQTYGLGELVEPVIWSYSSLLAFPPGMLESYQTVWGGRQQGVGREQHARDHSETQRGQQPLRHAV